MQSSREENPEKYFSPIYDTKERFTSYWHQIDEVLRLKPQTLLVIGIGNGLVPIYLKQRRINVITLDIEKRLNPDIVGNVVDIPLKDNTYNAILCCEVLEHQPYENFSKSLKEIYRVTDSYLILSLPDASRIYPFSIRIPKIGYFKRFIHLPRFKKPLIESGNVHYWEIGRKGYPLRKIMNDIQDSGFQITRYFNVFENPWHKFFILKKPNP